MLAVFCFSLFAVNLFFSSGYFITKLFYMKVFVICLAALLCMYGLSAFAQDDKGYVYDGTIKFIVPDLPRFEDYSDVLSATKLAEDIDFDSYEGAWSFRTRLRNGLKKDPNFAGKYKVVTHGCGTSCQVNWIVDTENGKIVDRIGSSHGISYKLDSRLIIKHPPTYEEMPYNLTNHGTFGGAITFYIVRNNEIYELLSLKTPTIKWDDPKYPLAKGYP